VQTGYSVTTIGHAETGRLWQARAFWEQADAVLAAGGELTRLHDAYRAETAGPVLSPGHPAGPDDSPAALTRMTLHWSDGSSTTFFPLVGGKTDAGSRAAGD
jgi:hypothetical protein